MKHTFTVMGQPAAQGSKRHVGNGRMVEQSKKVGPWREAVKAGIAVDLGPQPQQLVGPLKAIITFWFPRPKYHYRANGQLKPGAPEWMDKSPDIDKCLRSTFDALTDCGVIRDDSQFVAVEVDQQYIPGPGFRVAPGASVALYELTPGGAA